MVISLARLTLRREWRRFLPAVLAVGFSGLLILAQLALLLGIFHTVSVCIDASSAAVWVGFPDTPSVDLGRNIALRNEVFLRQHPEVTAVEKLSLNSADIRKSNGTATSGTLLGLDTRPDGKVLSKLIPPALRAKLDEPDTVLIDVSAQKNLQVAVDQYLEINRKRVKVVAIVRGLAAIGGPNVVASAATARSLDNSPPVDAETTYFVLSLKEPARASQVVADLTNQRDSRAFSAWTAEDFSLRSRTYWMFETGMGIGFLFSGLVALVIGLMVTSQTMKSIVLSSLREYATLRALGVGFRQLRWVVLEQALWIGITGVLVMVTVTAGVVKLAESKQILILAPPLAYLATAVCILMIALAAGWMAVNVLKKSDPATLLR